MPQHDVNTGTISVANGVAVTVGIPTRNRSRLLEKAIASVLAQTYRDFTLMVSDNASTDRTAEVVTSFRDPRVVYRPLERSISRPANTNRLIDLAATEFLLLLGDDDELHSDHLSLTVDALKRWPTVGVVHTGYSMTDLSGKILVPHVPPTNAMDLVTFEPGARFLERSMKTGPALTCLSSAIFRRAALVRAGGLREEDGVIDDFPLLMRIAMGWDFAYVNRPLAVMRTHADASSASLGAFTPDGFRSSRSIPDILYMHRRNALREAELSDGYARRLARVAGRTYGRDVLAHLSMRAKTGDSSSSVFKALGTEIRQHRRLVVDPIMWRFVVGQLGARRLRDRVRRGFGPKTRQH